LTKDNGASFFMYYDPTPDEVKARKRERLKEDVVIESTRFLRSAFAAVGLFAVLFTVLSFYIANEQWKGAQSMREQCVFVYPSPTQGGP
jgi:hypothetical protein